MVRKFKYTKLIIIISLLISVLLVSFLSVYIIRFINKDNGVKLVKSLYQFQTAEELDKNMLVVKDICSTEVFEQLTIDNVDRTLNTYLKFKNSSVSVNILKSTKDYVLYSLNTDYIAKGRKFLLTFETDFLGKIIYVREMECIDF